jgi:hypothetical protein
MTNLTTPPRWARYSNVAVRRPGRILTRPDRLARLTTRAPVALVPVRAPSEGTAELAGGWEARDSLAAGAPGACGGWPTRAGAPVPGRATGSGVSEGRAAVAAAGAEAVTGAAAAEGAAETEAGALAEAAAAVAAEAVAATTESAAGATARRRGRGLGEEVGGENSEQAGREQRAGAESRAPCETTALPQLRCG